LEYIGAPLICQSCLVSLLPAAPGIQDFACRACLPIRTYQFAANLAPADSYSIYCPQSLGACTARSWYVV